MSQQTALTDFFTVATAEEIARNNEHRLATYRNDYQAKQAFKEVSAALSAEELAEKLRKNAARRARKYQARLKAANKGPHKQVSLLVLILLWLIMLQAEGSQATCLSNSTSSPIAQCHGFTTQEGHQEAVRLWNSTCTCQGTCQALVWP